MHRRVQASFFKYGGKPLTTNKSETEAKFSCCRSHIRLKLLPDLFISSFFLSFAAKSWFLFKESGKEGKKSHLCIPGKGKSCLKQQQQHRQLFGDSIGWEWRILLASPVKLNRSSRKQGRESERVCVDIHESVRVRIRESVRVHILVGVRVCVCARACQRQREVEAVRQWKKNWWLMVSESDASCVLKMFYSFLLRINDRYFFSQRTTYEEKT